VTGAAAPPRRRAGGVERDAPSMAILLLRHGETALNAQRVLQPADTPLSERGHAQAHALAQRLAGERIAAILSSDLPRAWDTARPLGAVCGLPVTPSALLHERNFGALRGRPYDTLGFDPLVMDAAAPQGESAAAFAARVRLAFDAMLRLHTGLDGDLAVVTHGLVIRVLLGAVLGVDAARLDGVQLANTSVSRVAAEPPHALLLLNCTRHLEALGGTAARSLSGG
jgi:probable phosphoglycerate mutase